ncbi:hypothetical protein [Streptomyces chilikensis]|uniref:hypothetical protein n=1 Tax=Streptomyces chilikensis TaxID=1194079 RepID=UPI001407E66B|nr:hypothetical protein [Streptomyces chilikensis]
MPADEELHGPAVDESDARTGPRHAAPRKPLRARLQIPRGKAMAIAAMPTAVLMGMGLTPTLAQADDRPALPKGSLTAEEYQACVEVVEEAEKGGASEEGEKPEDGGKPGETPGKDEPGTPGKPAPDEPEPDEPEPDEPAPGEPDPEEPAPEEPAPGDGADQEPAPEETPGKPNLLDGLGDALEDLFDGPEKTGDPAAEEPGAEAPAEEEAPADAPEKDAGTAPEREETSEPAAPAPKDAVEETAKAVEEAAKAAEEGEAAEEAEESAVDPEDCPVATDEEGGLEAIVALPDRPWELQASSLLLKGSRYEGVVKVKTANGTVKKVLKYVVSDGTDIGDLHQTVRDDRSGKTHHVVAAEGSTSTIRGGDTVMYTESISGKLLGFVPVTFSPEHPPPLDIPVIYFTDVKVVQAGQFGGNLTVPGLRQYAD